VTPEELTGEAAELFESWRAAGYSEAAALERVQTSGVLEEQGLYESFIRQGMPEPVARNAARGRLPASRATDYQGRLEESFRKLGLSEEAAKVAAAGRDGPTKPGASSTPLSEAEDRLGVGLLREVGELGRQMAEVQEQMARSDAAEDLARRRRR
jgi:hypothetical protein